ncbi:hypothetical protein DYB37_010705 [Aphanomyces astaci]|uniref:Uncharacterized protein n=1 Tax=Aphanomyces astaci TaxID=112090 RepID=A0A3R6W785_APHAT|nr:hypothetical protein DYB35_010206 [Aphanomyces astaci]RHZ11599.1 hypothetical protein DYB37_010705 [Aphanomyces astaci]
MDHPALLFRAAALETVASFQVDKLRRTKLTITHTEMRTLVEVAVLASRVLSMVSAIFVLYCEIMGSHANQAILVGVSLHTNIPTDYNSPFSPAFLPTILTDPDTVRHTLESICHSASHDPCIAYLDTTEDGRVDLQAAFCNETSTADYLYGPAYLLPVLTSVLADSVYHLSVPDLWAFVDCSYFGRISSDTSTVKVTLLDKRIQNITTLFLQTVSLERPWKRRASSGGAATFTTTALSSLKVVDGVVHSTERATYQVAIGWDFPYDVSEPFVPVVLTALIPPSGRWHANVAATDEPLSFSGSMGIYRKYPDVQASVDYYYWDLPSDPMTFMSTIKFPSIHVMRDGWGYYRYFIGFGIGFNLAHTILVACIITVNIYRRDGILWIPDVYPSIQRRVVLRTVLWLSTCYMTDWWYPFQTAMNQGSVRRKLEFALYLPELVRSDCLMLTLAVVYVAAAVCRVRVQLFVVVGVYLCCFAHRIALVEMCGVYIDDANEYLHHSFSDNICPGNPGGMDLWIMHENKQTNYWLLVTEGMWSIVAMGTGVGYVLGTKLWQVWRPVQTTATSTGLGDWIRRRRNAKVGSMVIVGPLTARGASVECAYGEDSSTPQKKHWTLRSALYDGVTAADAGVNTHFERSAGRVAADFVGFAASSVDYAATSSSRTVYVSESGVWLLGFVVVDDRWVVGINDVLLLAVNVLNRRHIRRVYGFPLNGNEVAPRRMEVDVSTLTPRTVWNLSLKAMK